MYNDWTKPSTIVRINFCITFQNLVRSLFTRNGRPLYLRNWPKGNSTEGLYRETETSTCRARGEACGESPLAFPLSSLAPADGGIRYRYRASAENPVGCQIRTITISAKFLLPREVANGNRHNFVHQSNAQLVLTQQIFAWNNGNHGNGEKRMLIIKSRRGSDNSVTVRTSYQRNDIKICHGNGEIIIAVGR